MHVLVFCFGRLSSKVQEIDFPARSRSTRDKRSCTTSTKVVSSVKVGEGEDRVQLETTDYRIKHNRREPNTVGEDRIQSERTKKKSERTEYGRRGSNTAGEDRLQPDHEPCESESENE